MPGCCLSLEAHALPVTGVGHRLRHGVVPHNYGASVPIGARSNVGELLGERHSLPSAASLRLSNAGESRRAQPGRQAVVLVACSPIGPGPVATRSRPRAQPTRPSRLVRSLKTGSTARPYGLQSAHPTPVLARPRAQVMITSSMNQGKRPGDGPRWRPFRAESPPTASALTSMTGPTSGLAGGDAAVTTDSYVSICLNMRRNGCVNLSRRRMRGASRHG